MVLPTRRSIGWSMLGQPVKARALRLLADEQGYDGEAACAAVLHALRHEVSPYGAEVDRAIGRALGEAYREALAPAAEAVRALAAAYVEQMRRVAEQLGPFMADVQRGRTRPQPWVRPLDGRRRARG